MPSILSAGLIQPFIELTLYGIYFVIFSTMVYLSWHRTGLTKRPMIFVFLALVFQFLVITAHWINTMCGTYLPFVQLGGGVAAEQFYTTLGTPSLKIHIFLSEIVNTVTDCLVIHRLYVIREHRINIVILPICLLLVQIRFRRLTSSFSQRNRSHSRIFHPEPSQVPRLVVPMGHHKLGFIDDNQCIQHRIDILEDIKDEPYAPHFFKRGPPSHPLQITVDVAPNFVLKGIQAVVLGLSSVLIHTRIGLGWTRDNPSTTASNPTAVSFTANVARSRDVEETELEADGWTITVDAIKYEQQRGNGEYDIMENASWYEGEDGGYHNYHWGLEVRPWGEWRTAGHRGGISFVHDGRSSLPETKTRVRNPHPESETHIPVRSRVRKPKPTSKNCICLGFSGSVSYHALSHPIKAQCSTLNVHAENADPPRDLWGVLATPSCTVRTSRRGADLLIGEVEGRNEGIRKEREDERGRGKTRRRSRIERVKEEMARKT
ncbi:hypothetical protein DFH09DRAFT_1271261 [Mycena vulgaris]|nr:hypothetical protein DFH09DRAFT_1271261 [Mycena vulgaris]